MRQTTAPLPRSVRFRIALARLGLTASRFADDHDITRGHLRRVLIGERTAGPELREAIDQTLRAGGEG